MNKLAIRSNCSALSYDVAEENGWFERRSARLFIFALRVNSTFESLDFRKFFFANVYNSNRDIRVEIMFARCL